MPPCSLVHPGVGHQASPIPRRRPLMSRGDKDQSAVIYRHGRFPAAPIPGAGRARAFHARGSRRGQVSHAHPARPRRLRAPFEIGLPERTARRRTTLRIASGWRVLFRRRHDPQVCPPPPFVSTDTLIPIDAISSMMRLRSSGLGLTARHSSARTNTSKPRRTLSAAVKKTQ